VLRIAKLLRTSAVPGIGCLGLGILGQAQMSPRTPQFALAPPPPVNVANRVTLDYEQVQIGSVAFRTYMVNLQAGQSLTLTFDEGAQGTNYKGEVDPQCTKVVKKYTPCVIVFGFQPTSASAFDDTAAITSSSGKSTTTLDLDLTGNGVSSTDAAAQLAAAAAAPQTAKPAPSGAASTVTVSVTTCTPPDRTLFPTIRSSLLPPGKSAPSGAERLASQVAIDFGVDVWGATKEAVINCFYQTNAQLAFFTQVRSIYNAASTSATVTANIGSYNFNNGMQIALGTNVQAGPSSASTTTAGSSSSSTMTAGSRSPTTSTTLPTLTSSAAGQAAQNLFYGGSIFLYDDLPVFVKKTSGSVRWHFEDDILGREGVDIQNFSGTSTSATSPNTHFNALNEAYWQYDADPSTATAAVPLAIFIGGQYGYAYTSHGYAREYGFVNKSNAQVGNVAAGLIVTGQFNISVLRQFGPSQQYILSTTGSRTVANNFKSWSFGIQYQSKGLSP
jgi:hypothetical protein